MVKILLFLCFVVSFVVTLLVTPAWIKRARNAGLVGRDMHKLNERKVAATSINEKKFLNWLRNKKRGGVIFASGSLFDPKFLRSLKASSEVRFSTIRIVYQIKK